MRLWAIKMLFVWRWRLGYWDWDAFRSAWRTKRGNFPMTKHGYGRSPTREILEDCKRLADESNQALEEANEIGARMLKQERERGVRLP